MRFDSFNISSGGRLSIARTDWTCSHFTVEAAHSIMFVIIIGENAKENCIFDAEGVHRINLPPFYYKKVSGPKISHFEKIGIQA